MSSLCLGFLFSVDGLFSDQGSSLHAEKNPELYRQKEEETTVGDRKRKSAEALVNIRNLERVGMDPEQIEKLLADPEVWI